MSTSKITVKPHFLHLARLVSPYLTFLIIPAARALFLYFAYGKASLTRTFVAEGIAVFLTVALSIFKLRQMEIVFCGNISVKRGLIFRVNYVIPESASRVLVLERNPLLTLFGAVRLKIYTEAGSRKRSDENILISRKTAELLRGSYKTLGQTVKSNTFGEVIMSAALSSVTTGLLLALPAIKIIMSLLGKSLPSLLPTANPENLSSVGFAKFGRGITLLLIVGYIISFLVLLLRNFGFFSVRSGNKIMLSSGKLPNRTAFLEADSVHAVRTVTAPLMLLVKKCAVKFSVCGYGRLKGEIGLLFPCVRPSIAKGLTSWLLPRFKSVEYTIKPDKRAVRRIVWLPLFLSFLAAPVLAVAKFKLRPLQNFAVFVSAVLIGLGSTLLGMRLYALKRGGLSVDSRLVTAKGTSGFFVDELQIQSQSLLFMRISSTPFDRRFNHCTVKLRAVGKNQESVRVKYLLYKKVERVKNEILL